MTPVHTAIIDWDGTAVPQMWPEHATEFNPGFVDAMRRLHEAGVKLIVASARLSPLSPWTGEDREPAYILGEIAYIRDMLDAHGLTYMDIWTKPGKPGGSVYVDDKAERYHGRPGSWNALTDKILLRLGAEEPIFPAYDLSA